MRTKKKPTVERSRVLVKNYFNQEQLDQFSAMLRGLPIPVGDKEIVARAFADTFDVKEKERLLAGVV